MKDLQVIEDCFRKLECLIPDFGARLNFWCCGSCGHAAMQSSGKKEYIFAHEQAMERAFDPIIEERYFDENGIEVSQWDNYDHTEEETVGYKGNLNASGLYLYHHLENAETKEILLGTLRTAGFEIEWNGDASKAMLLKRRMH